jgi:hypothetical protein
MKKLNCILFISTLFVSINLNAGTPGITYKGEKSITKSSVIKKIFSNKYKKYKSPKVHNGIYGSKISFRGPAKVSKVKGNNVYGVKNTSAKRSCKFSSKIRRR